MANSLQYRASWNTCKIRENYNVHCQDVYVYQNIIGG